MRYHGEHETILFSLSRKFTNQFLTAHLNGLDEMHIQCDACACEFHLIYSTKRGHAAVRNGPIQCQTENTH